MRTAIIVGVNGQDGQLLRASLATKAYSVVGISRTEIFLPPPSPPRSFSIADRDQVNELMKYLRPDEVYYLAAHHHSSEERSENDLDLLQKSFEVNVFYPANFLQAIKDWCPKAKLFYACSSMIFGRPTSEVQDEDTKFSPRSTYASSKLAGLLLCRRFAAEGVFAATGILYNHESHLRSDRFVSKKIINAAVAAYRGESVGLAIGMLEASADWGYAPDFVDAMQRILELDEPHEFIVATGVRHTVREFVEVAFRCVGLDHATFVREDLSLLKDQPASLVGNFQRLSRWTGWRPSISFDEMVELLMSKIICEGL